MLVPFLVEENQPLAKLPQVRNAQVSDSASPPKSSSQNVLSATPFNLPEIFVLFYSLWIGCIDLDHLLESTVDGRADVGDILPEVDGGNSALADALGGELELL